MNNKYYNFLLNKDDENSKKLLKYLFDKIDVGFKGKTIFNKDLKE